MPLISIILPTYNSEKVINVALESILIQTFTNFEVIIIDGESTDDTLNIAKSSPDIRIKIISEKDKGVYDAMNKAITLSKGKWLYFMGSDDRLYNKHVLQTLSSSLQDRFKIVYGNVLIGDSNQPYCGELNQIEILFKNICHQAIFYNRVCFREKLFNLAFPIFADHAFNIDIICNFPSDAKFVDYILANYGNNGISSYKTDTFESQLPAIRRKYLNIFSLRTNIKYFLYSKQLQLRPSPFRSLLLRLYKFL